MRFFGYGIFCNKRFNLDSRAVSQFGQCFLEIDPLAFHHKFEDVAALVTLTKTAPCPRLGPDHESRRVLVIVEGTETRIILACVAQFNASLRHEVYDIYLGFDFINS